MKSTTHELPKQLEDLIPAGERSELFKVIVSEARQGEFHDFTNDKYAAPKLQLVCMLQKLNDHRLDKIIQDIMNGIYDES